MSVSSLLSYWISYCVPLSSLSISINFGSISICLQLAAISLTLCLLEDKKSLCFYVFSDASIFKLSIMWILDRLYSQICPCIMIESISALASGVPMETGSHCILGNYGNEQRQTETGPLSSFLTSKRMSILYNEYNCHLPEKMQFMSDPIIRTNKYLKVYIHNLFYPYCSNNKHLLSWFLK